jgi:hypothetical protein
MDADGALHAIVTSPADTVHSGLLLAAPENQLGVPQSPPGNTRFHVNNEAGSSDSWPARSGRRRSLLRGLRSRQ